jgi:5-oxoprolinase (ATP-hydrolysing)
VKITVDRDSREATVDFTGTSRTAAEQLQRAPPVTRAAVLYVLPGDGGKTSR